MPPASREEPGLSPGPGEVATDPVAGPIHQRPGR